MSYLTDIMKNRHTMIQKDGGYVLHQTPALPYKMTKSVGWMMKRGGFMKKYQRRYMTLFFYRLSYYLSDSPEDLKNPRGEIEINGECTLKLAKGKKGKNGIRKKTAIHFLHKSLGNFWYYCLYKVYRSCRRSAKGC